MSRDGPRFDWDGLLWETRGYLGLGDDNSVPLDELRKTAEANGWSEREFQEAHRDTDRLVNAGTLDEPKVDLDDTAADTDDEDPDTGDNTPRIKDEKPASNRGNNGETPENVALDPTPEIEQGVFPEDLKDIAQWLTWKATMTAGRSHVRPTRIRTGPISLFRPRTPTSGATTTPSPTGATSSAGTTSRSTFATVRSVPTSGSSSSTTTTPVTPGVAK